MPASRSNPVIAPISACTTATKKSSGVSKRRALAATSSKLRVIAKRLVDPKNIALREAYQCTEHYETTLYDEAVRELVSIFDSNAIDISFKVDSTNDKESGLRVHPFILASSDPGIADQPPDDLAPGMVIVTSPGSRSFSDWYQFGKDLSSGLKWADDEIEGFDYEDANTYRQIEGQSDAWIRWRHWAGHPECNAERMRYDKTLSQFVHTQTSDQDEQNVSKREAAESILRAISTHEDADEISQLIDALESVKEYPLEETINVAKLSSAKRRMNAHTEAMQVTSGDTAESDLYSGGDQMEIEH